MKKLKPYWKYLFLTLHTFLNPTLFFLMFLAGLITHSSHFSRVYLFQLNKFILYSILLYALWNAFIFTIWALIKKKNIRDLRYFLERSYQFDYISPFYQIVGVINIKSWMNNNIVPGEVGFIYMPIGLLMVAIQFSSFVMRIRRLYKS